MKRIITTLILLASTALANSTLVYCGFETAGTPCTTGAATVNNGHVTAGGGAHGNALDICQGGACSGATDLRITTPLAMRRGSISFWIKHDWPALPPLGGSLYQIGGSFPGRPYLQLGPTPSKSITITAATLANPVVFTASSSVGNNVINAGDTVVLSGGSGAWTGMNGTWTVTSKYSASANWFSVALDTRSFGLYPGGASVETPGYLQMAYVITPYWAGSQTAIKLNSDRFIWDQSATPAWQHFVITYQGEQWQMYRNGALVSTGMSDSPFPATVSYSSFQLSSGVAGSPTFSYKLDELAFYDWVFNAAEVAAAYNGGSSTGIPLSPSGTHPDIATCQIAPGNKQVYWTYDAGDNAAKVTTVSLELYRNGSTIGTARAATTAGWAEGLIAADPFSAGSYQCTARAYGAGGEVSAVQSSSTPYTQKAYLGHNLGIHDNTYVPAPWSAISFSNNDQTLNVYPSGRNYQLAGGYGLPQQIAAAMIDNRGAVNLLSSPMTMGLVQSGTALTIAATGLAIESKSNAQVTWRGSARTTNAAGGNQVSIVIDGELNYDGFTRLWVTVSPVSGTVSLDTAMLLISIPNSIAQYLYLKKDTQSPFMVAYEKPMSATVGITNTNIVGQPSGYGSRGWDDIALSNDDAGLFIHHPHTADWNPNTAAAWQKIIRNSDTTVSYEADLSNTAFTLSAPRTYIVYLMPFPFKLPPAGWRLAMVGDYGGTRITGASRIESTWLLGLPMATWNAYALSPTSLSSFSSSESVPIHVLGKSAIVYTQAHTNVNLSGIVSDFQGGVCDFEDLNTGYYSLPSGCVSDLWAYMFNINLNTPGTPPVVDGYYTDESYSFKSDDSFNGGADTFRLAAGGVITGTLEHGTGQNEDAARGQWKRLWNLFIDAGVSMPIVAPHLTGSLDPIQWSHATFGYGSESQQRWWDNGTFTGFDDFDKFNNFNSLLDFTQTGNGFQYRVTDRETREGLIPVPWPGNASGSTVKTVVTAAPTGSRTNVTIAGPYTYSQGNTIAITGATGSWTPLNTTYVMATPSSDCTQLTHACEVNSTTYQVPLNASIFGSFTGSSPHILDNPWISLRQRQAECLETLHDKIPQNGDADWWQVKKDFGIDSFDTVFNGWWSQTAFTPGDPANVKVSYFKRANSLLAYIANFATTDWTGSTSINMTGLGWGGNTVSANQVGWANVCNTNGCLQANGVGYSYSSVPISSGAITLTVPRHQCTVIELNAN